MPRKTHTILILIALLFSIGVFAQKKPLTNNDIVKMVKAGLPTEIILESIRNNKEEFDVSADGLIALKEAGIPDNIIQAMVARSGNSSPQPSQPFSRDRGDSSTRAMRGVTLIDGSNQIPMQQSMSSGMRSSGGMVPFGKVKSLKTFNGSHAQIRTTNQSPIFEAAIYSNANPDDAIVLVKLASKSDRREISTGRARINFSAGFSKDDIVPVTINEIPEKSTGAQKVFSVTPAKPLPKGEYALVILSISYYDFGVDSK
jgi:hypothetical protein